MQLTDFCVQVPSIFQEQNSSVIFFKSKNYSPLAFASILKWLQKSGHVQSLTKLDLDQDLGQLEMKLATTFLGQSCTFWFGDLSLISSKKKRADWLSFVAEYQGPHTIIGWLSDADDVVSKKKNMIIQIADLCTSDMLQTLPFLYQDHKPDEVLDPRSSLGRLHRFFAKLFRYKKEFSLEQLCLLQSYAGFLGKNVDDFFEQWLDQLIIGDVSLFYLAQLFFEKKADVFLDQWHHVRPYYSDQFWTVFFSDQLFKAYFYVVLQGRVEPSQKQLTYGLPFSFLKNDWRWHKPAQLQQAHAQLYEVDLALKSGASSYALDNFLMQFFV
jgi:hypothetical protein